MQNKANFSKSQMFITLISTTNYSKKCKLDSWSKQTQTKPIYGEQSRTNLIEYGHRLRYICAIMSKKAIKPRLIAFEVTRRCRYSCLHCRASAGASGEEELTTSQCKKILKSVAKFTSLPLRKQGCVLILTGGEPMERGDIYELIRYGRKIGLRPVLATCGYMIDEKTIVRLKKAGITALSFSLDGAGAETHDKFRDAKGAFDSAVNAAKIARKERVPFQINTTISRINIDEVIGIARLAKELGAYCFNPFILVPTGRGREIEDAVLDPIEYEMLLNELLRIKLKSEIKVRVTCGPQFALVCKRAEAKGLTEEVAGCMGGVGFGFISYRGDVQTCGFLDVPAGNLIKSNFDFGEIWEKSEFLREIRSISNYKGNCGICEYVGICGGCRARAYATSGDYLGEDPVCNYKQGEKG
jgi:radical SAM protein with 4Fe4S-binding SPASM domain